MQISVNIQERVAIALDYFNEGYNCAQSVLMTFNDHCDFDLNTAKNIAAPFGGGIGKMREVCGACSGMFMLLGIIYTHTDPSNKDEKELVYSTVQKLAEEFKSKFGTINCGELLALNEKNIIPSQKPCSNYVAKAVQLIGQEISK